MKILRIKLKNLNSLLGEHEVDFEQGPLAAASLFLVTGPTGAGKSTLLDAITLALYGRAARYANTANPEDMMSRHCGECGAEVEFEIPSGRYRAEWKMRRARGKADGRMQPPLRHVYDAGGQSIASTINQAEQMIEKLVGLDYSRFLRSALLAQGEFARFLKANANERAELLESLTGLDIYSDLSILAHEETVRREKQFEKTQQQQEQVACLTDEQRQEREHQIRELELALAAQKIELERLNRRLEQARDLEHARANEQDLCAKRQALGARARAAAGDLARLGQHRRALPYADDLNQLDAAAKRAREQEAQFRLADGKRLETHRQWMTSLAAACQFAQNLVQQEETTLKDAQDAVRQAEARRRETEQWLAEHAGDKELGARLPELAAGLSRLESLRREAAKAKEKMTAVGSHVRAQQQEVEKAETAVNQAALRLKDQEAAKATATQTLNSLLDGRAEAAREQELEQLRAQLGCISRLFDLEKICRQKRQGTEENARKLVDLAPKIETAQAATRESLSAKQAAARNLEVAGERLEKARLAASFEQHRAALKPGGPCPLCGATEHPFAEQSQPSDVIADSEARVRQAKAALAAAEEKWRAAENLLTRLQTEQTNLTAAVRIGQAELEEAEDRRRTLARTSGITAADAQALEAAKNEKESLSRKLREILAGIRQAAKVVADGETARLKADKAAELAAQKRANEEKSLGQLQAQLKDLSQANQEREAEIRALCAPLADSLAACQIPLPDAGQETATRESLNRRTREFQSETKKLSEAEKELEQVKRSAESSARTLGILQQKADQFQAERAAHSAEAADLDPAEVRRERSRLAGVSAKQPPDASALLDEAAKAVRIFENDANKVEAAAEERRREQAAAAKAAEEMSLDLTGRLAGSAFASIEALRAARLSPREAEQFEELERRLKQEADELNGRLAEVRGRISGLRAANVAEGKDVQVLEEQLQAAQKAHDELVSGLDRLRNELRVDEENRRRRAELGERVEQEGRQLRVWRQLQGLIGSHDGSKFRCYAQGITLDVLTHLANRHLRRLTDRYRMRRRNGELELEIEDLYQAGVTRPMASLSGGESFLASLALALGLATLAGRQVRIDSLFIDEGFGYLDAETLDLAISALETLRQDNKTIGIVSHVDLLKERILTQIIVHKKPGGSSTFRFEGATTL